MAQQITITIPDGTIGNDILEMMHNLSPDDKYQIALDVTKGFFESDDVFDLEAYKQTVINDVRSGKINTNTYRVEGYTDEAILGLNEVRRLISSRTGGKQTFLMALRDDIYLYYQKAIAEELKTDPRITAVKDTIIDELIKVFPDLIQTAIIQSVAAQFGPMGTSVKSAYDMAASSVQMTDQLRMALHAKGLL